MRNRMSRKRIGEYFLAALICIGGVACLAGKTFAETKAAKQSDVKEKKVVALVNGQPIYEDRLEPGVEKGIKKFKRYGMKQENPEFILRLQKKALVKVIDEELVIQESQKIKVKDLDAKVEEKLKKMKRKYKNEERFEAHLKMKNLTLQQAKKKPCQTSTC